MTRVHFLRPRGMTFQTFALEQSRQPGKRAGRGVGSEEPMGEGGVVQLILLHVKHTRVHPGIPKATKVDRAFSPLLQSARNVLSTGQENIRLARPRRALPLLKRLLWGWAGGSTPGGGAPGGEQFFWPWRLASLAYKGTPPPSLPFPAALRDSTPPPPIPSAGPFSLPRPPGNRRETETETEMTRQVPSPKGPSCPEKVAEFRMNPGPPTAGWAG